VWDLNRVLSLDELFAYSCDWVRDYLHNNSNLSQENHRLCLGIKARD
jgi:hypothetical protein